MPVAQVEWFETRTWALSEAIDYALTLRGGALRERICEVAALACGLDAEQASMLAGAMEAFHLASLILDDLPCMDDADERRGRRCLHRVMGEGKAVLTALAFINRGYCACWALSARFPANVVRAQRLLDACIGERGILDGQDRDLSFHPLHGAPEVRAVARLKTGALLRLCLQLPAVLTGAPLGEQLALARLARAWGLAYQAIDDFADVQAGARADKTPQRDSANGRPNLVLAVGAPAALAQVDADLRAAQRQLLRLYDMRADWLPLGAIQRNLLERRTAVAASLVGAHP